jgi:hypothetical protein
MLRAGKRCFRTKHKHATRMGVAGMRQGQNNGRNIYNSANLNAA